MRKSPGSARAETVWCPTCDRGAGLRCVTAKGAPCSPHGRRYQHADRARARALRPDGEQPGRTPAATYADEHATNPCNVCGAAPGVGCQHDEGESLRGRGVEVGWGDLGVDESWGL